MPGRLCSLRPFIVLQWDHAQTDLKSLEADLHLALHDRTPWRRLLVSLGSVCGDSSDTQHQAAVPGGKGTPATAATREGRLLGLNPFLLTENIPAGENAFSVRLFHSTLF